MSFNENPIEMKSSEQDEYEKLITNEIMDNYDVIFTKLKLWFKNVA